LKFLSDKLFSANREIPFTIIKHDEPSDSLAIILPGVGYTAQAPLLHYSSDVFFKKGCDVLKVNYRYPKEVFSALTDEEFTSDVKFVIDTATKEHTYTKLIFIAKSIGTIALSHLLDKPAYQNAHAIWLTPLLKKTHIYTSLLEKTNTGLCIIGDKDPHYDPKKLEEIKSNNNISLSVVEGGNQSLEYEDNVMGSIDILKQIIMKINEY
jgi:hypothetical protein